MWNPLEHRLHIDRAPRTKGAVTWNCSKKNARSSGDPTHAFLKFNYPKQKHLPGCLQTMHCLESGEVLPGLTLSITNPLGKFGMVGNSLFGSTVLTLDMIANSWRLRPLVLGGDGGLARKWLRLRFCNKPNPLRFDQENYEQLTVGGPKKSQPLLPYTKWGFAVLLLFLSALLRCISPNTSWVTSLKYPINTDWATSWGTIGSCSGGDSGGDSNSFFGEIHGDLRLRGNLMEKW